MELPDSLDLRMADRAAVDRVQRALAASDLAALVTMAESALQQMGDPAFRRWPGRMASVDWCRAYEATLSGFVDAVRQGAETVEAYEGALGAPLAAGYTTPFFQADYALLVRGGEWGSWIATRTLADERTRLQLFRRLHDPPPGLEVQIEVPAPCSFVSLGYLDGGILPAIVAGDRPAFERLLSAARPVRHGYADVNLVAPRSWLADLIVLARKHAPPGAAPWLDHLELLQRETDARGHDLSIGGWYGQSSGVTPIGWQHV